MIIGCESSNEAKAGPITDTNVSGDNSGAEPPEKGGIEAVGLQPLAGKGSGGIDIPPRGSSSEETGGVGGNVTLSPSDSGLDSHKAPEDSIDEKDDSDAATLYPTDGISLTGGTDSTDGSIAVQDGAIGDDDEIIIDEGNQSELPYAVGAVRIEINASDDRVLPVQLWYPAVESARVEAEQGYLTKEFEPPGERRDQLAAMLADSSDGCTSKFMHAAQAPEVLNQGEPFIAGIRMDEPNISYWPGCGTGPRHDNLFDSFTYVDNDVARSITKAYIAAFFQAELKGDASAGAYLETSSPAEMVIVKHHP